MDTLSERARTRPLRRHILAATRLDNGLPRPHLGRRRTIRLVLAPRARQLFRGVSVRRMGNG